MTTTDQPTTDAQQVPESPTPTTLEEALARINTTPDRAWALAVKAKWGFCADGAESPYEYDQDDTLVVHYDDLYDLASIALVVMRLAGLDPNPESDG